MLAGMPESHAARGTRRGQRSLATLGDELRAARLTAGLSLAAVARAADTSVAEVSRIERATAPWASVVAVSRLAAVVGLDLWVRTYPGPSPLRDAGHAALFAALRASIHPPLTIRAEVPIADDGDMRAWDAVVRGPDGSAGVEIETRLTDAQALLRRISLKARDAGLDRVLLVLADTRANRRAFRAAEQQFKASLPLESQVVLRSLAAGTLPDPSGVVFLSRASRAPQVSRPAPILVAREERSAATPEGSIRPVRRESATDWVP